MALLIRLCVLALFFFFLGASLSEAVIRSVKTYGATGDGTTDDTAAINAAIRSIHAGDELFFPCGTYLTSSGLNIGVSNVTVVGAPGCATIKATGSGYFAMTIGGSLSGSTPLTASAAELSTTFSANFANIGGLNAGDYVFLQEGGRDYSTDSAPGHDTGCDVSGCRGEILKIANVSGNTATVATALHFPYDPLVNAANVSKLANPAIGVIVQNLTFDGSGTVTIGLYMRAVAESTVANVKFTNFKLEGALSFWAYNLAWNNITMTNIGGHGGSMFTLVDQGNASVNGMTLSAWSTTDVGFALHTTANGTYANLTVNKAGRGPGRTCKIHATSYSTFNGLTCENSDPGGASNLNGIVLNYYSSHNTFNNCVVTNNSGAGIVGFGNYNQYNTFNNCTVSGNTILQMLAGGQSALGNRDDHYWTVNGGTYTSLAGTLNIQLYASNNSYVHDVHFVGPGVQGLNISANNACVNNNIFSGFTTDIVLNGRNNLGSGNTIPDGTIPALITGKCP